MRKTVSALLLPLVCVLGGTLLLLSFFITDPLIRGVSHSVLRFFLISAVICFLGLWAVSIRSSVLKIPAALFGIILFAGMALAAGAGRDITFSASERLQWYMLVSLFTAVLCQICRSDRGRWLVLAGVLTGGAAAAVYGIDQALYQFDLVSELFSEQRSVLVRGLSPALQRAYESRVGAREVFATFFHPNTYGGLMGALCVLSLACFIQWITRARRSRAMILLSSAAGVCLVFCAAGLFLSRSKGAWACTGTALLFLFCIHSSVSIRWKALVLACTGAAFLIIFHCTSLFDASAAVRKGYWAGALGIIRDYPFAGVGPGNFGIYYTQYKPLYATEVQNPHNIYLRYWCETGILTLIVFCSAWGLALFSRREQSEEEKTGPPGRVRCAWLWHGISAATALVMLITIFKIGDECSGIGTAAIVAVFSVSVPVVYAAEKADFSSFCLVRNGMYAFVFMLLVHSIIDFDAAVAGIFLILCALAAAAVCRTRGLSIRGRMQTVLLCLSIPCAVFMYTSWGLKNIECRTMESKIERIMGSRGTDPEEALEICEQGRKRFPRHHRFYALEVEICRRLGYGYEHRMISVQFELARLYRKKAAEWSRLGRMHEAEGEWQKAVRLHRISTGLYPYNPRYLGMLSRSLYKGGMKEESRETARKSLEMDRAVADPNVRLSPEERRLLKNILR